MPIKTSDGSINVEVGGVPVVWNAGIGVAASNRVCVTTTESPTDVYVDGMRLDSVGRIVVIAGDPAGRPYFFNGGLPSDKRNGDTIYQLNVTPLATDPFVAGVRVGELGGVYMTSATVPPPPVNTVLPAVTGVPSSSNTLTCDGGTWTGAQSIAFRWLRNNVPMIDQTGSTFTVNSTYIGDVMSCAVTAGNDYGTTTAVSNSVTIIALQTVGPDLDGDGVPDTVLFDNGTVMVTEDDDTINIDVNHDGIADIIIPNEVTIIP